MAAFFDLMHQTENLMLESATLAEKLGFGAAGVNIRERAGQCRQRELMVVVAGEVKRGKSSLYNALLNEEPALFPVDMNVCTNVVTVVRYGEKEKIEVHIEEPGSKGKIRIETISQEQIPEYVSEAGNPGNFRNVKLINASIPNELLKEGVVFVDTPGVGSSNIAHAEATYGFLPNADLLLFVSDTVSGMTESELKFLKRGYRYCKSILFVLTKKDLNADYAEILSDNRAKISSALELPPEEIQITPVSSMAKLRYLKTGSKTMYENSNFAALEDRIWTMIARRRGEVLLMPFLMSAKSELLQLMENVAAQYQLLDADQSVAQGLVDELQQKTAALEELQEKGADWRGQLNIFFSKLQNGVTAQQRRLGESARELLDENAKTLDTHICKEANYSQIIYNINDLISQGILDIREDIALKMEEKADELYRQMDMGIYVDAEALERIGYQPREQVKVVFPPKKAMDTAIKWGRNISMSGAGGSKIGMILGGFVGFCLGGPGGAVLGAGVGGGLGGLAGTAKGCVDSLTKYDQLDVNTVMKELNRHINNSMSDIGVITSNSIAELRVSLTGSFEQQLKKQVSTVRENMTQLQKNIHLAADEIPKKRAALEAQDVRLNAQIGKFERLEASIGEFIREARAEIPRTERVEIPRAERAEMHQTEGKRGDAAQRKEALGRRQQVPSAEKQQVPSAGKQQAPSAGPEQVTYNFL